MRKIWVKVDPWDKQMVTTALEGGADGIVVPPGFSEKVKALGRIETISEDGDLKIGEDVIFYDIKSGDDEEEKNDALEHSPFFIFSARGESPFASPCPT